MPGELRSAAFSVLHSGPSHNLLRPAYAELVSCGPLPLYLSGGGQAPRHPTSLPSNLIHKDGLSKNGYAFQPMTIHVWRSLPGQSPFKTEDRPRWRAFFRTEFNYLYVSPSRGARLYFPAYKRPIQVYPLDTALRAFNEIVLGKMHREFFQESIFDCNAFLAEGVGDGIN